MAQVTKVVQRPTSACESSVTSSTDERMSQRRVIELKKEEKKRLEETSCTFQPTMSARRGRDNLVKPLTGSRFDFLYNDAVKRKSDGPKNKTAIEESKSSFKPNISPRARSMSADRRPADIINSLHKGVGGTRTIVKEVPKDENLFQPKINKRANSADRTTTSETGTRLYAMRTRQEDNLQKKKAEVAAKQALECTFSPKVTRARSASRGEATPSPKPVIDRLLQYGEDKKLKLEEEKRLQAEKERADETFQPAIARTKFSPAGKNDGGSVYERLAQPIEKGKEFDAMLAAADVDLTFQPSLPKSRSGSVKTRSASMIGETIHDRLFRESAQKKMINEEEQRLALIEQEKICTFAPSLPARASFIAEHSGGESPVTAAPVFDRLNQSKQYMQNILSQIKCDMELNECTFQPTIPMPLPGASRRASEGPVHERLVNDANKIRRDVERRESLRLSAEVEGHTFHPSLPESSQDLVAVRRRSSLMYNDGDDQSVSTMTTGNVYERLSNAHTVSSLGGAQNDSDMISVTSGHFIDREKANAVVERLTAAGEKHKEDLKVWEEIKAVEDAQGATFTPQINEKSSKIAMKLKEEELLLAGENELDLGPMSSTRRKSVSKIPCGPTPPKEGASRSGSFVDKKLVVRAPTSPSKAQIQPPSQRSPSIRIMQPKDLSSPSPTVCVDVESSPENTQPSASSPSRPMPSMSTACDSPTLEPLSIHEDFHIPRDQATPSNVAPKLNAKKSASTPNGNSTPSTPEPLKAVQ